MQLKQPENEMKIVIDTNVFISGIFWKGVPGKIVEHWLNDEFILLGTPNILSEYQTTLKRIGKKLQSSSTELWINIITKKIHLLSLPTSNIKFCRDPDDDKFIYCALAGNANYLVSGDNDILSLKSKISVNIVTPSELLKIL